MSLASSTFHWDAFEPIPQERVKKFFVDPAHRIPTMLLPRQSGKLSPPSPWRVQLARIVRREMGIKEPELDNLPPTYIVLGNGENDIGYPGPFLVDSLHIGEESNRRDLLFSHIPFIIKE